MLGIIIPYYNNNRLVEDNFKKLIKMLSTQLTKSMILYIYEDGQHSNWLEKYESNNIIIKSSKINRGVSHARNKGINYLIDKVNYILFIDSDDMIDGNYLREMARACYTKNYDIIESLFFINDKLKEYGKYTIRSSVTGTAFDVNIINKNRFDEDLQIGEDSKFMSTLWKEKSLKKHLVNVCYFYNLGLNGNSLIMKYMRNEIGEFRND